jgi:hypothetical protein
MWNDVLCRLHSGLLCSSAGDTNLRDFALD